MYVCVYLRKNLSNLIMKRTLYFISFITILGALASCEKFELDDHCPEENQEQQINPQELRINDDSDSEETGKPNLKSESASNHEGDSTTSTSSNDGSNNDSDSGNPDDDDLINDDSDDEDEGGRPQNPNGNSNNGNPTK